MGQKSILGSILGSTISSVVIVGILGLFLIPLIFPAVDTSSIVLQSKYGEWDTEAYLTDDQTTDYLKMTDTELIITIRENSQISITFSAIALLALSTSFNIRSSYNISLVIVGISNRTFEIIYWDSSGSTGAFRQLTYNLYSNYLSQPLPSGTYTIAIYWKSTWDAAGLNEFFVSRVPHWNWIRSLWIQEIKQV